MKNTAKKILTLLLIAVMCVTSFSFAAFAEDEAPLLAAEPNETEETSEPTTPVVNPSSTRVDQITYSLAGHYPIFTWNKVELPSGETVRYALRSWYGSSSYSTGKSFLNVTGIKKVSYTATKGFNANKHPYYVQVCAYAVGSEPNFNGAPTATISKPSGADIPVATNIAAELTYPSKANNTKKLGEIKQKDNAVTVSWDVSDPTLYSSFDVYRVNSEGKLKKVGTTQASDKTSYTNKHYSYQGTFSYVVRAYMNTADSKSVYVQSTQSNSVKVKGKCIAKGVDQVESNVGWNAQAKKKISLYKSPGGKKVATVAKGTKIPATFGYAPEEFGFWEEPSWVEVKYNGEKLWAKWSEVKMCWRITHNDYAWSVKEDFINSEDADSNTDYLIWICRYTQRTNVFHKEGKKWKLIKVFDCNTGNYYQPLKGGQYYIKSHELKKIKEHRDGRLYYFMYSTKFGGSGTFHTRCRWVDTNGLRNAIKRHPTTKGCCRLYDAAAQYVYYDMPIGTGVYIH